jgi:hypothetical protein
MNKTNTLKISGRSIEVNFSVNYFFKYFLEATGIDLLDEKPINVEESNTSKIFDYLSGLIYAGNKAKHSLEKTEGALTKEEATDMVFCLTPVDAITLLGECMSILNPDEKNVPPQAARRKGSKAKVS